MTRRISAFVKLRLLLKLVFYILPRAAVTVTGAIVRSWLRKLPLGPAIRNAFAGTLMANIPPVQLQAVLSTTFDTYNAWTLARGDSPRVDVLSADNSTRLLWLGPAKPNKVVLFFHGMINQ